MTEIILDGREMQTTQDCLEQIFRATRGLMPDYGGRNLDALNDDLRELSEPLTIRWLHSEVARTSLFGWFDLVVSVLTAQEQRDHAVTLILE
jgi:RNAse (barnase) inhibitor barstar